MVQIFSENRRLAAGTQRRCEMETHLTWETNCSLIVISPGCIWTSTRHSKHICLFAAHRTVKPRAHDRCCVLCVLGNFPIDFWWLIMKESKECHRRTHALLWLLDERIYFFNKGVVKRLMYLSGTVSSTSNASRH